MVVCEGSFSRRGERVRWEIRKRSKDSNAIRIRPFRQWMDVKCPAGYGDDSSGGARAVLGGRTRSDDGTIAV